MAWSKRDDRALLYPPIMAVLAMPEYRDDDRIVSELRGIVSGLYDQVAAHTTDYVVDMGTVITIMGRTRVGELLPVLQKLGLLETCEDVRGLPAVRLADDPNFVHVRSKAELDWEQQQRNDTRNPTLAGPVRRRDGDQCRYCGCRVAWTGQKSPRSATLDHVRPGEAATPKTLVVACTKHNSALRDLAGEEREQLREAPTHPLYGKVTAEYLAENGYLVLTDEALAYLNDKAIKRPYLVRDGDVIVCGPILGERGDTLGQRPATPAATATTGSDPAAPGPASRTTPAGGERAQTPVSRPSERSSPGRVGSGTDSRSEPHRAGTSSAARKRNRRSRRGRPRPTDPDHRTPPTEDTS